MLVGVQDIWHRVVQLVTNNPSMQQYAARNMVDVLRRGAAHEVRQSKSTASTALWLNLPLASAAMASDCNPV
jgi:hypothetical protein